MPRRKLSLFTATLLFSSPALAAQPIAIQPVGDQVTVVPGAKARAAGVGKELVLNEVSPGPAFSYIEIYNGSLEPVLLDGFVLQTSTGSYPLDGLATPLASGEYAVLLQGHASETGTSNDSTVPCIVVATPTCGHVADTVLLRSPAGEIVDAVTYGAATADPSPRYAEGVAAGQFQSGTFVPVVAEYGELVLGRDRNARDTDHVEDWVAGGGIDALVGSPFGRNDAWPIGADAWIPFFQGHLTAVLTQQHFGITVVSGGYEGFSEAGATSSSDQTLTLSGDLLGAGEHVFAGEVVNTLTVLPDGYSVDSTGTLTSGFDMALAFQIERRIEDSADRTWWRFGLRVGDTVYPYELLASRSWSGTRGDFELTLQRTLTAWSGVVKVTTGTQTVDWVLGADGTVTDTYSSATFSRPWPLFDGLAGSPAPASVITTETVRMDVHAHLVAGIPTLDWTTFEHEYANDIPTLVGDGFSMTVAPSSTVGQHVESSLAGTFLANGASFPFESSARLTYQPGGKLFTWTRDGSIDGEPIPTFDGTFDPPGPAAVGFWSGLKSFARGTAKVLGTVAMVATGAIACASSTLAASAAGGTVTVATVGVASPAAVGLAAGGAIACGAAVHGASKVIDKIWEEER